MKNTLIPVLLAGGVGSRLWPLSREHYPKQLLTLLGDDSLLQATLRRILACDIDSFIVICNEEHRFDVLTQIAQLKPHCKFTILLEPVGRNTAPAAALAACYAPANSQLLFLPADHILKPEVDFVNAVNQAKVLAQENYLVSFGVKPTYAETGYGYIQVGNRIAKNALMIERFVEKPTLDNATQFIKEGHFYWNSGMYCFARDVLIDELTHYAPDILASVQLATNEFKQDGYFVRINAEQFAKTSDKSIDYAVMEHTHRGVMLPLTLQWSDIGSWQSLYEYETKDHQGNVVLGDVINIDNHNCYLRGEGHLLAAVGLENIIAVSTGDGVLIAKQDQSQKVKEVVQALQASNRPEAQRHLTEYHSWGKTTLLNEGDHFQIKQVDIEPGQTIELHYHSHTTESWLVVSGEVQVTLDNNIQHYYANQAFLIQTAVVHRLHNPTQQVVSLVEVRSGVANFRADRYTS